MSPSRNRAQEAKRAAIQLPPESSEVSVESLPLNLDELALVALRKHFPDYKPLPEPPLNGRQAIHGKYEQYETYAIANIAGSRRVYNCLCCQEALSPIGESILLARVAKTEIHFTHTHKPCFYTDILPKWQNAAIVEVRAQQLRENLVAKARRNRYLQVRNDRRS